MMILESRNINPGKDFALRLHPGAPSPECFYYSVLTIHKKFGLCFLF